MTPTSFDAMNGAVVRHDVVIVGGGLVGASLAIALEPTGLDVALVEATAVGSLPAVFDERNLSFADATVNALTALGVLRHLRTPGAPIRRIHVSRAGDFGRVNLAATAYGRDAFGQVVVARDFGEALEARLCELPHLTRYRPARFTGIDVEDGTIGVRFADDTGGRMLSTRLLVGADGTRSHVRDALDVGADEHEYGQTLFVARVAAEREPDGTAFERFGAHGPIALLPRADRHFGAVVGVADEDAETVAALDDASFLAYLQQAFGWRVGRLQSVGPRSRYRAASLRAHAVVARRSVLVGNAAQTLHPVGAQGFNLGLRDALTLAELIQQRAGDPGADGLLSAYAQRRSDDRERTLAFSDGLARATANPASLMRPLRSLGLLALDASPSLQAALAGGAMGYRGSVPALCRAP